MLQSRPGVCNHSLSAISGCSTVYSAVAFDDYGSGDVEVFAFERDAFRWLAKNSSGPHEAQCAELLQLIETDQRDAFWAVLTVCVHPFVQHAIKTHHLTVQPNGGDDI